MSQYQAMRNLPPKAGYKKGDVLVVFGELFSRGYGNGLVDAAEALGMTIVRATVGRRDENGQLRALTDEETKDIPKPFINIPLEAGFDMEPAENGQTPVDQLSGIKMKEWQEAKLDWQAIEQSQASSVTRFEKNVAAFMQELEGHIPDGANVVFAHLMAGGVPRAKILMPTMNKVHKGRGDRFVESETFWNSDLGKLCEKNFIEVTADTFKYFVEGSSALREKVQKAGGKVCYTAYGYHGTEILHHGEYQWQSYSPYVQGWAKMRLEDHARQFMSQGISCTVYNCPEILTNSSSIFLGVEVPLYPLMNAMRKEFSDTTALEKEFQELGNLLKPEHSTEEMLNLTTAFYDNETIQKSYDLETWPQHNTKDQMELMLDCSTQIINMHKDTKDLLTARLSEKVFVSTGHLILNDSYQVSEPVFWLNHDIVAKQLANMA